MRPVAANLQTLRHLLQTLSRQHAYSAYSAYSADHRGLNAVGGAFIRSMRPGPVGKPDNMPAWVPATSVSPCQLELLLSQFCGLNTLPAPPLLEDPIR